MLDTKYTYRDSDGIIDINTLSPSGRFYYKVQKPKALNPSAFGCKIAFYNSNNELVYHRNKVYAHELHDRKEIEKEREAMEAGKIYNESESKTIELVRWSKQGNVAYYLEHFNWNYDNIYDSVILHLQDGYCYRINEIENNFEIVSQLKMKSGMYDENEVVKKLDALELHREKLIKDEIVQSLLDNVINRKKWYP